MAPVGSQVACMFLLLGGTLLFGTAPVFVQNTLFKCECGDSECKSNCRARRGRMVTAFLIYFGGGVLLATTFLHLLPEAREGFEEKHNHTSGAADDDHDHHKFPIPELIVSCGFFAVYFFEEVVHFFLGGHSHVPTQKKSIRSLSRSMSNPPQLDVERKISRSMSQSASQISEATTPCSIAPLLTVAALSFHSLFEGFAVGLQPDDWGTWLIFSAVATHKFVIAFVVGLEVLGTGGTTRHLYSYMGVFSLMSPIGMAIAMITSVDAEESNPVTVSVLNAIATGTLIYVTFFEILHREEEKNDVATWIQLVATALGFTIMALVQFGTAAIGAG